MAKTKITAPEPGFNGDGPGGLKFKDGVGYTDDDAVIAYCKRRGYGVGDSKPTASNQPPAPAVDARDATGQVVGTRLRDAAVDPRPGDFLPPTNAGEADPHGPLVVAPGVHAAVSSPLVPGIVPADAELQQQRETEAAEAILVDGQTHREALGTADGPAGPLQLSDPSSADVGVAAAAAGVPADGAVVTPATALELPAKSARVDDWRDYARSRTRDPERREAIAGMSKAQLITAYDDTDVVIPPRGGEGSGRDEWAAYAASRGVDVDDAALRDDIIATLDAAGITTTIPEPDPAPAQ